MKHTITTKELSVDAYKQAQELYKAKRGQYLEYISQVFWWNKRVNLISRDVSHETMVKHVQHSLLLATVDEFISAEFVLDTGSGGGLPGLPLSIANPEKKIVVNDIVSKKMMAVKQIGRKLGCNNFETLIGSIAEYRVQASELIISKHAFKIGELIDHLGEENWHQIVFLKGEKEAHDEVQEVTAPLSAEIVRLDKTIEDPFYNGKAIVKLKKKEDEKL